MTLSDKHCSHQWAGEWTYQSPLATHAYRLCAKCGAHGWDAGKISMSANRPRTPQERRAALRLLNAR